MKPQSRNRAAKGSAFSPDARKSVNRILILALLISIAFSFGAIVNADAAQESGASETLHKKDSRVVVYSGDTLWSIAKAHAPKGTDIRAYVSQIVRLNGLHSDHLEEGQTLKLPTR